MKNVQIRKVLKRKTRIKELESKLVEIEFFLTHIEPKIGEAAFIEITNTFNKTRKLIKKLTK